MTSQQADSNRRVSHQFIIIRPQFLSRAATLPILNVVISIAFLQRCRHEVQPLRVTIQVFCHRWRLPSPVQQLVGNARQVAHIASPECLRQSSRRRDCLRRHGDWCFSHKRSQVKIQNLRRLIQNSRGVLPQSKCVKIRDKGRFMQGAVGTAAFLLGRYSGKRFKHRGQEFKGDDPSAGSLVGSLHGMQCGMG